MTKLRVLLLVAPIVVVLDQLTKWWVTRSIDLGGAIPVIDGFFSITHVLNRGIVFGFFQGGYVWLFLLLTLLAIGLIASFFRQLNERDVLAASALGLILGGAVGNGIDRLVRSAVVDFLHFDFGWFTYPDFNVADSGIVIGVGLLLFAPQTWDADAKSKPPAADDEARSTPLQGGSV
jgi:signal peptidase II